MKRARSAAHVPVVRTAAEIPRGRRIRLGFPLLLLLARVRRV